MKRRTIMTNDELYEITLLSIEKRQQYDPRDPFYLTPAQADDAIAEMNVWREVVRAAEAELERALAELEVQL
jgi:hypothetical protein